MAKNKGKYRSNESKEEAPQEQIASFGQKLFDLVRPHFTKIVAVAGGVTVVLTAFTVWAYLETRRETRASEQFAQVVAKNRATVDEDLPDPFNPRSSDPEATHYKTFQDRAEAALAEVNKLESAHGSSDLAGQALLVQAGLDYDLGKYDEAATTYQEFLKKGSRVSQLVALGHEGLGYAYEAKALAEKDATARSAGLDKALKAYQEIEKDPKGPFFATSLYHQARMMALLGDTKGAAGLYKKALEANPSLPMREEINNRLGVLETPAAPAATSAPAPAPAPASSPAKS